MFRDYLGVASGLVFVESLAVAPEHLPVTLPNCGPKVGVVFEAMAERLDVVQDC